MDLPDSSPRSVVIWGARAGHGASTVTGAIATMFGCRPDSVGANDVRWLWSGAQWRLGASPRVIDAGSLGGAQAQPTDGVVLRGPCTLALRDLALSGNVSGQIILISEPWRPLGRRDVESTLGASVVAEIPFSTRIPRWADAGLLAERFERMEEFDDLRRWAAEQFSGGGPGQLLENLEDPLDVG